MLPYGTRHGALPHSGAMPLMELVLLMLSGLVSGGRNPGSEHYEERYGSKMPELPRISAAELSDPSSVYYGGNLPFVLSLNQSTSSGVGSAEELWSVKWFGKRFGEEIVDYYPEGMLDITSRPYLRTMKDVGRDWAATSSPAWEARRSTPYIQWRLNMGAWRKLKKTLEALPQWFTVDEAWMKTCLPARSPEEWPADNWLRHCHWKVLVVGKNGSGMFFHPDGIATATYQVQVVGRKRWTVCGPDQRANMYAPGDIDVYDVDLKRFPLFAKAKCTRTIAHPGEVLYYPTGWWHQTDNLDSDTIGLAARRVDRHNYKRVYNELVHKCENPAPDITKKWPGAAPPISKTNCESIGKVRAPPALGASPAHLAALRVSNRTRVCAVIRSVTICGTESLGRTRASVHQKLHRTACAP